MLGQLLEALAMYSEGGLQFLACVAVVSLAYRCFPGISMLPWGHRIEDDYLDSIDLLRFLQSCARTAIQRAFQDTLLFAG